jgi:hypothetical protein
VGATVQAPTAVSKLTTFYDPRGGYAGLSFLDLFPSTPNVLGAGDLMAPSLMSAPLTPKQVREVLAVASQIQTALAALPATVDLATANGSHLQAACQLHSIVYGALSTNEGRRTEASIKADKLCARKRPGLFPIRDRRVSAVVGSRAWRTFQALLNDQVIVGALNRARIAASNRVPQVGHLQQLRVLDTILWMP